MTDQPTKIYVGWDSREDIAYQVCRHSIVRNATQPVEVIALRQQALRDAGLYSREADPLASTEFTYTRFLVPHLAGFEGWAVFCDCDFLWLGDVQALMDLVDDRYAVMCVHHDHRPPETTKMDGCVQTVYPRKNWSSMVLYNCAHPKNRILTPELVSSETGAFLHRFQWLDDDEVGEVPETWNWLDGWNQPPADGQPPYVVHYTRGGPWFDNWQHVAYAQEWLDEEKIFEREGGTEMWDVLDFWFEEIDPEKWFAVDEALDGEIKRRFGDLHKRAARGELAGWRETPWGALAEIVLLDQFSRNIYRGDARAFACDQLALEAHRAAMVAGFDRQLTPDQRKFLYLPLQHSEDAEHQARQVELFATLDDPLGYEYAVRHREIIDRFGRFPHRNGALGRETTNEEMRFLQEPNSSF